MAYASDTHTSAPALGNYASKLFAQLKEAYAKRKIYNQTCSELKALSNAELADIGINRSMIHAVAAEAAAKI